MKLDFLARVAGAWLLPLVVAIGSEISSYVIFSSVRSYFRPSCEERVACREVRGVRERLTRDRTDYAPTSQGREWYATIATLLHPSQTMTAEQADQIPLPEHTSTLVIGGGPAGLVALKYALRHSEWNEDDEPVLVEMEDEIGGTFR